MAYYDLISENDESTVVSEFEQGFFAAEAPYMRSDDDIQLWCQRS